MSTTFIQPGNTVTVPAPAAIASNDVVIVGQLIGVAQGDASQGAPMDITLTGCWTVPKIAADAFAVGDAVYWDDVNGLATATDTGTQLGVAIADAGASTATVAIRLLG